MNEHYLIPEELKLVGKTLEAIQAWRYMVLEEVVVRKVEKLKGYPSLRLFGQLTSWGKGINTKCFMQHLFCFGEFTIFPRL